MKSYKEFIIDKLSTLFSVFDSLFQKYSKKFKTVFSEIQKITEEDGWKEEKIQDNLERLCDVWSDTKEEIKEANLKTTIAFGTVAVIATAILIASGQNVTGVARVPMYISPKVPKEVSWWITLTVRYMTHLYKNKNDKIVITVSKILKLDKIRK